MFITVIFLSSVPLDECDLHEKDFRWQRSVGNKITFGAYMDYCDEDIKPSWYRFSTKAGGDMPTTCPPINSCGISAILSCLQTFVRIVLIVLYTLQWTYPKADIFHLPRF